MEKKIKKLTLMNMHKICSSQSHCNTQCPLYIENTLCIPDYIGSTKLTKYRKLLNKRIKL